MQIKDAKLAGRDDGPNSIKCSPVISLLVFAVLDESAVDNIGFKLGPRDKVVILAVNLGILFRPARICQNKSETTRYSTPTTRYRIEKSGKLRGTAGAKRSESCMSISLNSFRPMLGGPIKTMGLL